MCTMTCPSNFVILTASPGRGYTYHCPHCNDMTGIAIPLVILSDDGVTDYEIYQECMTCHRPGEADVGPAEHRP